MVLDFESQSLFYIDKDKKNQAKVLFEGFDNLKRVQVTNNDKEAPGKKWPHRLDLFLSDNFDRTTLYFDSEEKLNRWKENLDNILKDKQAYNSKFQKRVDEWANVNKWSATVNKNMRRSFGPFEQALVDKVEQKI